MAEVPAGSVAAFVPSITPAQELQMPEEQANEVVAPVQTGLEGLTLPTHEPQPVAASTETIAPAVNTEAQEAERAAVRAAAAAEEAQSVQNRLAHDDVKKLEAQIAAMQVRAPGSEAAKSNEAFYQQLLDRRNTPPAVPVVQPVAPPMSERTKREMAEGAKQSARHAAQRAESLQVNLQRLQSANLAVEQSAQRAVPQGSTPVFRPISYVPDQQRGQGYIKVTG